MKPVLFVLLLFLVFLIPGTVNTFGQQNTLDGFAPDGYIDGLTKKGNVQEYNKNGLYGYIDGGAELFLEFGFDVLRLQKYQYDNSEISVDVYRMTSPEAALAIYLMKCGEEKPIKEVLARNTGDFYQLTILKGNCFITVNNYDGKKEFFPVMVKLANRTLQSIQDEKAADLFSILPTDGYIEGTKLLVRGMYSLQSVYTLGEGDILSLKNETFGVTAQYKAKDNTVYHLLYVKYKSTDEAKNAFLYLCANLDSYIKVLEKGDTSIRFTDYKGKEGSIVLNGEIIQIRFSR